MRPSPRTPVTTRSRPCSLCLAVAVAVAVQPVTMPGESVTEGTVTRWLKSVGDQVPKVDEAPPGGLDRQGANTEIPSPVAGC